MQITKCLIVYVVAGIDVVVIIGSTFYQMLFPPDYTKMTYVSGGFTPLNPIFVVIILELPLILALYCLYKPSTGTGSG